jgi:hypothetical protein
MLANGFRECQSPEEVLGVGVLPMAAVQAVVIPCVLVFARVSHLWKTVEID